jgi:hypothetical protein
LRLLLVGRIVSGPADDIPSDINAVAYPASVASLPAWRIHPTVHEKLLVLKSWLGDCEENHGQCKPDAGYLPKRLIDVGYRSRRPPRLVNHHHHLSRRSIKYATLSYCWGEFQPLRTTKKTVGLYAKAIPPEIIPPTFQDALAIVKALGIPYLWIDALCIVQDDDIEWRSEACKMEDVYAGSSLTIAATHAADAAGGCFTHDHNNSTLGSRSRRQYGGLGDVALFSMLTTRGGPDTLVRVQTEHEFMRSSPSFHSRGWILQEMVLSHRTVHCLHSEFFWQCRSGQRTESGIVPDPFAVCHGSCPILPKIPTAPDQTWWELMKDYSGRKFTFWKDRVPAMAGITRHFQKKLQATPLLGLWVDFMPRDLLWSRALDSSVPTSSHLPTLPSWSWLSYPGKISWGGNILSLFIPIGLPTIHSVLLDWSLTWASEPLTSDIKSTRLIIEGPVRGAWLGSVENCQIPTDTTPLTHPGDIFLDRQSHSVYDLDDLGKGPLWHDEEESLLLPRSEFPNTICSTQFDYPSEIGPLRYILLLLCSIVQSEVGSNSDNYHYYEECLILEPFTGSSPIPTYRRVGIARFFTKREKRSVFDLTLQSAVNLV